MRLRLLVLLLCAALPAAGEPIRAPADAVRVALHPGWREPGGRHVAGLAIHLAPGWKTYWRAPGPLGIPPRLDWRRSENVTSVTPAWPRPRPVVQAGGRAIGYTGAVMLPLLVDLRDPARATRLRGTLDIGVCREVCLPMRLRVDATLPAAGAPDPAIHDALADRPEAATGVRCRLVPGPDGPRLQVAVAVDPLGGAEAVAVEAADPDLWLGMPDVARSDGAVVATLPMASRSGGPVALDREGLRITAVGTRRAVEAAGCAGG